MNQVPESKDISNAEGIEKESRGPHDEWLKKRFRNELQELLANPGNLEELVNKYTQERLELESRADHDSLTGLLNYQGFVDALVRDLEIIKQTEIPTVLAFLDIDRLREFNNSRGHPEGNRLIKTYAKVLQQELDKFPNSTSLIGRYGGDEFVYFLTGLDINEAQISANEIRVKIIEAVKEEFQDLTLERTVSIGITALLPNDTADTLLSRADKALLEAKQTRNRVITY